MRQIRSSEMDITKHVGGDKFPMGKLKIRSMLSEKYRIWDPIVYDSSDFLMETIIWDTLVGRYNKKTERIKIIHSEVCTNMYYKIC